jgi:hypothetical protein
LPCFVNGQFIPDLPEIKGRVKEIVEKKYGKYEDKRNLLEAIFNPNHYSGSKYTYLFDQNSNLLKQTTSFQGKVVAVTIYEQEIKGNTTIVREKPVNNENDSKKDYVEYENFRDTEGRIVKVNYWAYNEQKKSLEIFQVDQDAEYDGNRLDNFTRYLTNENGDLTLNEKCSFEYNSAGQLVQIERKDLTTGFRTILEYKYDSDGLIKNSNIDFLVEIQEYKKTQIQDISYRYDQRGNWIRKYLKSGDKNILESKRKIIY